VPRLKMLAVKDCLWIKDTKGWRIDNCPLGEGLVDWAWVATALRDARFSGPISVHLEYELPPGTRHTLEAAARDLAFARRALA
jgi:sugar phosphate isomerase/epimerase